MHYYYEVDATEIIHDDGSWFGAVLTALVTSTNLSYVEPG